MENFEHPWPGYGLDVESYGGQGPIYDDSLEWNRGMASAMPLLVVGPSGQPMGGMEPWGVTHLGQKGT